MPHPSNDLDITTAAIIIAIAVCVTASILVPAAIAEWKVKRRNDEILAKIAEER